MNNFGEKVSFIWSVADLLRGPYRPNQYKDVMLPLTVLRRLDCVLEPTKEKVLEANKKWKGKGKIQLIDSTSFFKKMRKSLGNKRHEVCDDQRDEITRLYGTLKEGDHTRIFDNEDFGYRRITVERSLKLNFVVDKERIPRLEQVSACKRLASSKKRKDAKAAQAEIAEGTKLQKTMLSALHDLASKGIIKDRDAFSDMMKGCFKDAGIKVPSTLFKTILMALAERDETANVCTDSKGNPESDSELRDNENVPLKEDVGEYVKREVLPYVPDAWVDDSKNKIGYEINFNRYFYQYTPPRPLENIEADLKKIESKIADMLAEVTE